MTHEELEALAAIDALGGATPDETRHITEHLRTCAACSAIHAEMLESAAALALQLDPVAPPVEMRDRILAAVRPPAPSSIDEIPVADEHRNSAAWWFATAATLLLALWGWRELAVRSLKETLRNQTSELRQLEEQNQLLDERNAKLSAQISALAAPDVRTIALASTTGQSPASARLFLDPSKRRAVIFFFNLPPNGSDRSYQLWMIRADQPKPQSAGTFDVPLSGRASLTLENLPVATEIKGLAVTLEPHGGVEQPTSSILLSGNT